MASDTEGSPEKRTPLYEEHVRLGANLTGFAGYLMPLRYGSEIEEHNAVRERCGLFDVSHMGQMFVEGPGASAALSQSVVGDVSALSAGRARYTMICNGNGGVLDDLIIYRLDDEQFLVIANASNKAVVHTELEARGSGFEVTVGQPIEGRGLIALQGPKALDVLGPFLSDPVPGRFRVIETTVLGKPVLVARTGYTGEDGVELSVAAEDTVGIWTALLGAVRDAGGLPCGLAARDSLRLEAALPLYGNELTDDRTPYVAGLGWVVDLEHDFVGHDALVSAASSPPSERLVGLVTSARRIPRHSCSVVTDAGAAAGIVTSGGYSPTLARPIAMAYVDRDLLDAHLALSVDLRGRLEPVEVVPLPFLKKHPREPTIVGLFEFGSRRIDARS